MFVAVCDQNSGNSTSFCSNDGLVLAADERVAQLPLDLVERMGARMREQPPDAQRLPAWKSVASGVCALVLPS